MGAGRRSELWPTETAGPSVPGSTGLTDYFLPSPPSTLPSRSPSTGTWGFPNCPSGHAFVRTDKGHKRQRALLGSRPWAHFLSKTSSVLPEIDKAEKQLCNISGKRRVGFCERNNSAVRKVSEDGGRGAAPGTRALIFLQPVLKTMVREVVSPQPMKVRGRAEIHPVEDPKPQQMDVWLRKM